MSPEKRKLDRRRFPRLKAPVHLRPSPLFGKRSRILDISQGGAHVYSDRLFQSGEKLEIKIFLPKGSSVEATARVVWIKERPPDFDAFYDVGIEFIRLPYESIRRLKSVLNA